MRFSREDSRDSWWVTGPHAEAGKVEISPGAMAGGRKPSTAERQELIVLDIGGMEWWTKGGVVMRSRGQGAHKRGEIKVRDGGPEHQDEYSLQK